MPHDLVERTLQLLSDMNYTQWAALGGCAAATYATYRRYTRISLDDVPGPENPSFLHGTPHPSSGSLSTQLMRSCMGTWGATGNTPFLQNAEVGEFENRYLTTYGSIVRWKGAIGVREFLKIEFPPLPDRGLDR